jgi:hypothetical protein
MEQLFPGVFRVSPSKPTPSKYFSYFVERPAGNLLIPCYSASSTIDSSFPEFEARGGLAMQLLGDSHFKTPYADTVAERFGAPLYAGEPERADVAPKVKQAVFIPYTRHELAPGVEAIPTPGHRPGGVCYLVTLGKRRYLFSGDAVWHDGKDWNTYPAKAGVKLMRESLALLAGLDFDVLLCNTALSNPLSFIELKKAERGAFFEKLSAKLG